MYDYVLRYGFYLEHHGVKGQKWGVRRYQNEDGSWTSAGKKHLKNDIHSVESISSKNSKLAYKYSEQMKRSNALHEKSEKLHMKQSGAKRLYKKSEKLKNKADFIRLNSSKSDVEKEVTASKYEIRASKKQTKADKLAKTTKYSNRAYRLAIRSDKVQTKALRVQKQMASNEVFSESIKKSVNEAFGTESYSAGKRMAEEFLKKD